MKVSTILSAAVAASLFWSCALGFDTTLPDDASAVGDVEVMGDTEGEGDIDIDSVSDVQLDGNVSDADSASDTEVERDADVVIDADGGIDADTVPDMDVEGDITVDVEADDGGSDGVTETRVGADVVDATDSGDGLDADDGGSDSDTEAGSDADMVDATDSGDGLDADDGGGDSDTEAGSDADVELDVDVVSGTDECALRTGSICTGTNNVCRDTSESYVCSCATGSTGLPVIGDNAECTLQNAGLGSVCLTDSQCPENSWCSTVTDFRRCSPRLFGGAEHEMEFVFVPAGTFEQGSDAETSADERPYTATISRDYFVSRTEVTQGQWKAATGGANGSCFQATSGTGCTASNANDNGPVEKVDWYSALAFANALSVSQGLSECYTLTPAGCDDLRNWATGNTECTGATFVGLTCTGYRLLTESEWERAARGGTSSTYYWGEDGGPSTVGMYAWFQANADRRTQSVGAKLANAFGLYDMSGNVSEWVWDVYVAAYPDGRATGYLGPTSGSMRGHRGGRFSGNADSLRPANRTALAPSNFFNEVGFRLARTAP